MIETYFGANLLASLPAFISALVIGISFGWCLEQAGFGSSRRLSGIFYFRDMAVLKVMFSAVITAMLGLLICKNTGLISLDSIYMPETFWGAQIIGGLLFGVGFVMGGWCPGTATVGAVSGKFDAVVFLFGSVLGSMAFSESFKVLEPYYKMGASGLRFIYNDFGVSSGQFALILCFVAILAFWFSELIEKKFDFGQAASANSGLWVFSIAILIVASGVSVLPERSMGTQTSVTSGNLKDIYSQIATAGDHIEPEELARELVAGNRKIICVDVRTADEYSQWHIPGARNFPFESIVAGLNKYKNYDRIVLYSNGAVHPAQIWVLLRLEGYKNCSVLADGLTGLFEKVLKPAALRVEPLSAAEKFEIGRWRSYFLGSAMAVSSSSPPEFSPGEVTSKKPGLSALVTGDWLEKNLASVKVIDTRDQPDYNSGHINGAISLNVETFRANIGGKPSVILPARMIAEILSLAGIRPEDKIVIVDDKIKNSTLVAAALTKVGHADMTILNGGYKAWKDSGKMISSEILAFPTSVYPAPKEESSFIIETEELFAKLKANKVKILDARPVEQFSGKVISEARGGHIPGAINRPSMNDLMAVNDSEFRPVEELTQEYANLLGSGDEEVVTSCRTGHSASQIWYVLTKVLGRKNVRLYDESWTVWAADKRLPAEL